MDLSRVFRTSTFRFAALYVVVFVGSVIILGIIAYFAVRGALEERLEANMRAEVAALAKAYRAGGLDQLRAAVNDPQRRASWRYRYRVVTASGATVVGAISLLDGPTTESTSSTGAGRSKLSVAGVRALSVALDDKYKLSVANNEVVLRDLESALAEVIAAILAASLLFGLVGGWIVSSRYLARIDRISETAQSIIAGDLTQRIPVNTSNDELDRLALTLNGMLERIGELMESLRQVSNDIAHDLRTPLSRLRQRLETASTSDSSSSEMRDSVAAAISDTDAILETFGALLRIAQIEAGTRKSGFVHLALSDLVQDVVEAYEPAIEDQDKHLVVKIEDDIAFAGDRDLLAQLVANLIENSLRHTPRNTTIRIELRRHSDGTHLVVADDGPGVPSDQKEKLFDRFYRSDQSRNTPGSGLGLSLVKAIADLHGSTIKLRDNLPGLAVEVSLPEVG